MKIFTKQNLAKAFNAMVITFAFAAMCHLILVMLVAVFRHNRSYLNPLDFLGISIIFPEYRDSLTASLLGWLGLTCLFLIILYVRVHYHLYVSIVKESYIARQAQITGKKVKAAGEKIIKKTSKL